MSEELTYIPSVDEYVESGKWMKAGLNIVRIDKMLVHDKQDKNGNPGAKIIFINKDQETIDDVFYYSPWPINDPRRKEESTKCPSEWKLAKLKGAMKMSPYDKIDLTSAKKKYFWLQVNEVHLVTDLASKTPIYKDGKPIIFRQATSNYWILENPNELPINADSSSFIEYKVDTRSPKQASSSEQEQMPVDDFPEPNQNQVPGGLAQDF